MSMSTLVFMYHAVPCHAMPCHVMLSARLPLSTMKRPQTNNIIEFDQNMAWTMLCVGAVTLSVITVTLSHQMCLLSLAL